MRPFVTNFDRGTNANRSQRLTTEERRADTTRGTKMETQTAVEKSQKDEVLEGAEVLVADLKKAEHFGRIKESVMKFVASMDGRSDDGLGILGDMDYAILLLDSLDRRGKTKIAPMMLRSAVVTRLTPLINHIWGICEELALVPPVEVKTTDVGGQPWSFNFDTEGTALNVPPVAPRLPITLRLRDSKGKCVETANHRPNDKTGVFETISAESEETEGKKTCCKE
jgi:hypothetical protein